MPVLRWICGIVLVLCTARAMGAELELVTGDRLLGQIIERSEGVVVLKHSVLGRLEIPADQISEVKIVSASGDQTLKDDASSIRASLPAELDSVVDEVPPPPRFLEGWDSQVELGLTGTSGNSNVASFRGAFKAKRETETERSVADAAYFVTENRNETTRNEFTAGLIHDRLLPESPWFLFVKGRYDFDQFRPWRHRLGGHGGLGLTFVKRDDLELNARLGGGLVKELDGERELRPEGLIGTGLVRWNLTEKQTLSVNASFFPDLAEWGEFRVLSNLDWKLKLDTASGLSLKIGIANEYESVTEHDAKHNDLKYYSALVVEF